VILDHRIALPSYGGKARHAPPWARDVLLRAAVSEEKEPIMHTKVILAVVGVLGSALAAAPSANAQYAPNNGYAPNTGPQYAPNTQYNTTYNYTPTTTTAGEEQGWVSRRMAAPSNALELKVGTGYTQGFGMLRPAQSILDVAGAGLGVNADIDYRASPHWSVGVQGEYQEFENNTNTNSAARGMAGNLGVTYHGAPFRVGDPWLRFGTGYRLLWSVSPNPGTPTVLTHGFEVGKATFGYDMRASSGVAIAPVVGIDLNIWTWQDVNGLNATLPSAQVGTYVYAGLQGRFDVGGTQQPGGQYQAKR
jgi:hypothetical protein